ncbi:MAG: hypothetical protein J7K95_00600 [Thermoplasmata archaeon]|nr:hypothetical protein [Thermoplasmata archaeon]
MNNKGQVGIIVAILVISLLVAVLVIIQTYYVPQWMKDREAEHMDVVANQFASLKYSIDLQAMERSSSPLINSVTLGSKELPYFISSRAFGSLQILSSSESNFSISVSGSGRNLEHFYHKLQNGNLSHVNSFETFGIWIDDLESGDYYNAISPYFNISLTTSGSSDISLNLLIKNGSGNTIFNGVIYVGKAGEIKWIDLLDSIYNFSLQIMPHIQFPINITANCSNNGSFIIRGYRYGNIGTVSFPPLYLRRMGEIKYSSENAYFVNQNYIYEGGAVVLEQHTGSSIIYPPLIHLENSTIPYINITAVDIVGIQGKTGAAGYGTYPIRTNYSSTYHAGAIGNLTLTIYTKYADAWEKYMNTTLNASGLSYTLTRGNGYIQINFNNARIEMDVVKIYAQIGPGWVV